MRRILFTPHHRLGQLFDTGKGRRPWTLACCYLDMEDTRHDLSTDQTRETSHRPDEVSVVFTFTMMVTRMSLSTIAFVRYSSKLSRHATRPVVVSTSMLDRLSKHSAMFHTTVASLPRVTSRSQPQQPHPCHHPRQQPPQRRQQQQQLRWFESESEYHPIADDALATIQDAIDDVLDSKTGIDYEISVASGVLTLSLPPHGTWVINKQTPNQQLWWSSPLSGPKRFEYDDDDHVWISTKDGLALGPLLVQEIRHVLPGMEEFEIDV